MALFVPNPDAESVEEIIEQLSLELARAYREAEDELIREIAIRAARDMQLAAGLPVATFGLTPEQRRRQNRILADLAGHRARAVRDLQGIAVAMVERLRVSDLARRVIEVAATEGEAAAAAQLGLAGRQPSAVVPLSMLGTPTAISAATMSGTASQAVAMVALSLQSRLEILNQRITRYPQDAYQRIIALHSPNTLLGVTTSRQQQAAAVQRFLAEGIPSFIDRSDRRWTIGAYAEMAGRTSVNRAYNDAGIWRMQQSGVGLVTVVRGLDSCRKCAAWAGKILSTDGTPPGPVTLPHATSDGTVTVNVAATVDGARNAGWGHPNCRCRLVPYLPGLTVPQADTTYDEVAEKERAEQRRLEREIRAAKRREATALTDTDRARAARDVRAAQADMREFIGQTGRIRQSYREQLHFSDGRGPGARAGQPPTPPRPSSSPVAFRVAKGTTVGDSARHAVSQMRAVHSIPRATPQVTVERMPTVVMRAKPNTLGSYRRADGVLWLRPDGDGVELTAVHELGHWLDNKLFGDDRRYGSEHLATDAWKRWAAAVEASVPTQYLRAVRTIDHPDVTPELVAHIDYLLGPREQFARAYAQWVATRTGDRALLDQLSRYQGAENYTLRAYPWPGDDFTPIGAALDDIFRERGLLK